MIRIYKRKFKGISLIERFCLLFKKPHYTRDNNIIIKSKKFNNKIYCLDIIEVENEVAQNVLRQNEVETLQQRIDKAIEYIELKRGKNKSSYDCEILNILRDEDNEK